MYVRQHVAAGGLVYMVVWEVLHSSSMKSVCKVYKVYKVLKRCTHIGNVLVTCTRELTRDDDRTTRRLV